MDKKQLNVKDILINNGIVILILLMVLFVGVTKQNFFSRSNFSNISINVACRFIIAVGVSGCLITKGTDLSAGRLVGLSAWQVLCSRRVITADILNLPKDLASRTYG